MFYKYLWRFMTLAWVWVKYDLDELLFSIPLLKPVHFLSYLNPVRWFHRKRLSRGERIRLALETMGPIFVKFGQMLSTRHDILPEDIIERLSKLQDHVKPFDGQVAKRIVEQALNQPLETVFNHFEIVPLASASIAQVHAAELQNGEKVVVKVVRPTIKQLLKSDFSILYSLAKVAARFKHCKRLRPVEVVREIEKTLHNELDLLHEASNASQFRRNCANNDRIYIPKVYWPYCFENVMVMERIGGIPVSNLQQLKAEATEEELKYIAETGVEIFYQQVFSDNFFHADMHPGNLFIDFKTPGRPTFIAVDFGIMGSLSTEDKNYLAANFLAFFKRDYRRVAELHIESGWVPEDTRVTDFESAIRTVCEPIFELPLKDVSCAMTLMRLFQIARRFDMDVMPQLLLLQKTLLNIEGLGRAIYPDLDLWATAKPYLEKWMKDRIGLKGFLKRSKEQLPLISERLPEIPQMIYQILQAKTPNTYKSPAARDIEKNKQAMKSASKKRKWFLGVSGGLIALGVVLKWFFPSFNQLMSQLSLHPNWIMDVGIILLAFGLLTK